MVVGDGLVEVAQLVMHGGDPLEAARRAARLRLQVLLVDRERLLEERERELELARLELLQPVREEGRGHAQRVLRAHALAQLRVEGFHHWWLRKHDTVRDEAWFTNTSPSL